MDFPRVDLFLGRGNQRKRGSPLRRAHHVRIGKLADVARSTKERYSKESLSSVVTFISNFWIQK